MTKVLLDYPHRMGGHCGSGALSDLLDWAGLGWEGRPSEGLVFGLGGGLSFMYWRQPEGRPPVYLVGRTADMELDLCARLGIRTERRQTDDPDLGWRWVLEELDRGRPVMIWADIAHLPYLRVRLSNTRHDIVVVGYDTERRVAWVVDNDRPEVEEVPWEALARARASTGFPDPNRHATYPMRFPDRLPDLLEVAREAAAASVEAMAEGRSLLTAPDSLPPGTVSGAGLAGVEVFVEDLARWPEVLDEATRTEAAAAVEVFVEKAGTGGGMFRRLQADFCAEVARLTGEDRFGAAAAAYRRCARSWSELARRCREDPADHAALSDAARALPAHEAEALAALDRAAGGG